MIKESVYPCKKKNCVCYGEWLAIKTEYPMVFSHKTMWKESKSWWKRLTGNRGYSAGHEHCIMCKYFESFDLFAEKDNESTLETDS